MFANPKTKPPTWVVLLMIVVIGIAVLVSEQENQTGSTTPVPTVVQSTISIVPTPIARGDDDLIVAYFTHPTVPYDGRTEGGIETHLISLIKDAQVRIDAAVFEFDLETVAEALIDAHNRGVVVRLVYDDEHADKAIIDMLRTNNIPVVPDSRSAFMHNKFFVIDGATVWTGSFNITINAAYKNNENALVIHSSYLAKNYTNEFNKMFGGSFGPTKTSDTPYPETSTDTIVVFNYFAPQDDVMSHVVSMVSLATRSIDFMTFSFTDDTLGNAMMDRMDEGVVVRGIFESRGANADSSECARLLAKHADIRLDGNPYTLHNKVIIIDNTTVITGSFNFSENANESNDENLLIIYDPILANYYTEEFTRLYLESHIPTGGVCLQ